MRKEKWIIDAYEEADEGDRLDMYMICRENREAFDEIEGNLTVPEKTVEPGPETGRVRTRWNLCGRLIKAFGS